MITDAVCVSELVFACKPEKGSPVKNNQTQYWPGCVVTNVQACYFKGNGQKNNNKNTPCWRLAVGATWRRDLTAHCGPLAWAPVKEKKNHGNKNVI